MNDNFKTVKVTQRWITIAIFDFIDTWRYSNNFRMQERRTDIRNDVYRERSNCKERCAKIEK